MARMPHSGGYAPNGAPTPTSAVSFGSAPGSHGGSQNGGGGGQSSGGPSANNRKLGLYKTELCRSWEEKGSCRYGPKCQFAHGEDEIRKVARHPKYKTEICRTFWVSGSCPYGKRCCFIHTELPAPGGAPGAGGSPPADTPTSNSSSSAAAVIGRERSLSTNSDPSDVAPVSLLTRIANQRSADAQAAANNAAQAQSGGAQSASVSVSTPTEGSSTPTYQFPQQRPNSLRVDTTLDTQLSMKQNKSAYPYMNNHSLPKSNEHMSSLISPGPVTAGPDLGRSASRFDVYNDRYNKQQVQTPTTTGQQTPTNTQPPSTLRHSFNGTENLALQTQLALSAAASGHAGQHVSSSASSGHPGHVSSTASSAFGPAPPMVSSDGTSSGIANRASPAPLAQTHSRSGSASAGGAGGGGGGVGPGASAGAGGWGGAGFTRGHGLAGGSAVTTPGANSSPWSGDLSVGSNRLGGGSNAGSSGNNGNNNNNNNNNGGGGGGSSGGSGGSSSGGERKWS